MKIESVIVSASAYMVLKYLQEGYAVRADGFSVYTLEEFKEGQLEICNYAKGANYKAFTKLPLSDFIKEFEGKDVEIAKQRNDFE